MREFEHDAHAEMFFIPLEKELGGSNANYSDISLGVGKGSCLKCQSTLDNTNIPRNVEPGGVDMHAPRHVHPNDIKIKIGISKPL